MIFPWFRNSTLAISCLLMFGCLKPPDAPAPVTTLPEETGPSACKLLTGLLIADLPDGKWQSIEEDVSKKEPEELFEEGIQLSPALLCPEERQKLNKDRQRWVDLFLRYQAVMSRIEAEYRWLKPRIYEEVFGTEDRPHSNCAKPGEFNAWCANELRRRRLEFRYRLSLRLYGS